MKIRVRPEAGTLRIEFDIERKCLLHIRFRESPPLAPRLPEDDFIDAFPKTGVAGGAAAQHARAGWACRSIAWFGSAPSRRGIVLGPERVRSTACGMTAGTRALVQIGPKAQRDKTLPMVR